MTGIELLEKYPLSIDKIREFYQNKMLEALHDKSVTEEFAKFMLEQGVPEHLIISTIEDNPRMLFDVFDKNNIIIETFLYPDDTFTIKIGQQATTLSWKTRKESELWAIEAAFDILEQKLTPKEIE